jgi:hypothetical protein
LRYLKRAGWLLLVLILIVVGGGLGTVGGSVSVGLIFSYVLPASGFPTSAQRGSYISKWDFTKDGGKYVKGGSIFTVSYETMRSSITACGIDVDRFIKNTAPGNGDQDSLTDSVHQQWTYGSDGSFHVSSYSALLKMNVFNGTYRAFSRVTYHCNPADTMFLRVNEMDPESNAVIHVVCAQSNDGTPGRKHQPEDDYTDCGTKP